MGKEAAAEKENGGLDVGWSYVEEVEVRLVKTSGFDGVCLGKNGVKVGLGKSGRLAAGRDFGRTVHWGVNEVGVHLEGR